MPLGAISGMVFQAAFRASWGQRSARLSDVVWVRISGLSSSLDPDRPGPRTLDERNLRGTAQIANKGVSGHSCPQMHMQPDGDSCNGGVNSSAGLSAHNGDGYADLVSHPGAGLSASILSGCRHRGRGSRLSRFSAGFFAAEGSSIWITARQKEE